ncbi:MAG TPA: alpha/beta hydrolase-fold protein [Bryobacteraceae bacterium]|nr:alpha/beta hydrolase-fold protein [Bryobacteraceae bacterium]
MRTTLVLCLALAAAHAQAPAGRAARPAPPPPGYRVNPDRTVTFTLRAPDATIVSVSGDFTQTPLSMTKSADGAWIVTSAALRPALYNYAFTVNGVRVVDPANPMIGAADRSSGSSMFEVRADKPQPWDIQPVPHGAVHIQYYTSKKFETPRMIYIYTPPGYESTTTRYPALYLMHGAGGEESSWFAEGRANLILDSVIAGGKAKPMVVVMPYGRPGPAARLGLAPVATSQSEGVVFPNDVVEDVIPFAEKNYRISARADDPPSRVSLWGQSDAGGWAHTSGHVPLHRRFQPCSLQPGRRTGFQGSPSRSRRYEQKTETVLYLLRKNRYSFPIHSEFQ